MKKYLSFFRIRFSATLQYRSAAVAGIVTQFVWGIMQIMLYRAFYLSDPSAFPLGMAQLSNYFWLNQAFLALFMTWFFDTEIFSSITDGGVAYELIRPMNLYVMWYIKNMAQRLAKAVLRAFPILIIAVFLPYPYGLTLPASPLAFVMFLVTLLLAFLLVTAYVMPVYIITFYTMNPMGLRLLVNVISELLAGGCIPLPFMPDKVRYIIELTPFGVMQNLPFRVYSGDIAGGQMWRMFGLQLFWLVVLVGIGMLGMRRATRRVVVQGG